MLRFLTFLFLFIAVLQISASEINYSSTRLKKELLKRWNVETTNMVEISELSGQIINEGKIFKVVAGQQIVGYVYVGRIISCHEGGCTKNKQLPISGNYEYFDAFILYNTHKTVETVSVFNYRATRGQEVCSRGWLKQFVGFDNKKPLEVGKSIDGISGATISVNALTDEVNYITQLLRNS